MNYHWLAIAPVLFLLIGCGPAGLPYEDHSRDPERFAEDVKEVVFLSTHDARSSNEPADALSSMLGTLQGYESKPVGGYGDIYADLLTQVSELHAAAEQANGKPSGMEAKLKKIEETADKLPGRKPTIRD